MGARDDPSLFQISVPLQPGNSGGPLIDSLGNVVGVTASQLDAARMMHAGHAAPQNVNYAVKISYVRRLIENLPRIADDQHDPVVSVNLPERRTSTESAEAAADAASRSTALVLVWRPST